MAKRARREENWIGIAISRRDYRQHQRLTLWREVKFAGKISITESARSGIMHAIKLPFRAMMTGNNEGLCVLNGGTREPQISDRGLKQ